MFRSTNELKGYTLLATDGEFGTVRDFLFDDELKITRYVVVDTGSWLISRQVLISPVAMREPDLDTHKLPTVLSKADIAGAPSLKTHSPVSRQHEYELSEYYNWPVYWGTTIPVLMGRKVFNSEFETQPEQMQGDPHLRSISEITGYEIQCMEGTVGHVEDIIIDTESWSLRYLIIDTRNWFPGKKVIIAFDWLTHITWDDRKAHVDLTQDQVKNAPVYDPRLPVNRAYETQLYDFHGRPTYW
tara:strand:+ start:17221 stop:17949 length:729 start_codon:yes stop_codon:yes gene_type:complete